MEMRDLNGRLIAVTGATSGIGYFIAEGLAQRGARVVVMGRSSQRADIAVRSLPGRRDHLRLPIDLADVRSVRDAAQRLAGLDRLDGLIMNAGVVSPARSRQLGPFGAEATVGVNVLSHMELLRGAMAALSRTDGARVISVGSYLTRRIPFAPDDWLSTKEYNPRRAYAMSKHATEILGFELARRLEARHSAVTSIITHPGGAIDALTPDRSGIHERPPLTRVAARLLAPVFSSAVQGKDAAARSAILSIEAAGLKPGTYIGPKNIAAGDPVQTEPVGSSLDPELGVRLWNAAEELLGAKILAP